ncbi:ribulose-phosphate 3-epimerase [Dialister sp.]|uniref:ribulose-phosphate 3-epimerase n=1 Tax=Dialister sp. TaxID=1955814 RepID=UPI002E8010F7|nr:ribulose-phosphate 3-epimerase [Dialister sp.]MEE3452028.1 ribulose-phosphate 3-epimerase [Dialister sp.]
MKIAPSLLAADFSRLAEEVRDIETGGADYLHLDVMDGHFVPNLSFGVPVIKALRKKTNLPFDVHLMVDYPEDYLDGLQECRAAMVSFHVEAVQHADRMIHNIRDRGIKAGAALNPGTSLSTLDEILPLLDFVLIMSVNPGFGGQKFIPYSLDKISRLKRRISSLGKDILIEVDGGVNEKNAPLLRDAGADILVAGSSVFGSPDRASAISHLKI